MNLTRKEIVGRFPGIIRPQINRALVRNPWIEENHKLKLIIIHVPRTGGSSLYKEVFGHLVGHPYLEDYTSYDRRSAKHYLKVGVVRNPWDRLVSAYYEVQGSQQSYLQKFWKPLQIDSIDQFFEALSEEKGRKGIQKIVHFRSQQELISDRFTNMDIVGRFENLDLFMRDFNCAFNSSYVLPHLNASKKSDYRDYYDTRRINLVREIYARDIEKFEYEFE